MQISARHTHGFDMQGVPLGTEDSLIDRIEAVALSNSSYLNTSHYQFDQAWSGAAGPPPTTPTNDARYRRPATDRCTPSSNSRRQRSLATVNDRIRRRSVAAGLMCHRHMPNTDRLRRTPLRGPAPSRGRSHPEPAHCRRHLRPQPLPARPTQLRHCDVSMARDHMRAEQPPAIEANR